MIKREYSAKERTAANQNIKEKEYWLDKLSGEPEKSVFPYDSKKTSFEREIKYGECNFAITGDTFTRLSGISKNNDQALHMILTAVLSLQLYKYSHSGNNEIMVSAPIYKQDVREEFINTVLVLRNSPQKEMTFKELLGRVRKTFVEAVAHQNYPMGLLAEQLGIVDEESPFPLADITIMLDTIHDRDYILPTAPNIMFAFGKKADGIAGTVEYNTDLYHEDTIGTITEHYVLLMSQALSAPDTKLGDIQILLEKERHQLLVEFNDSKSVFPADKTIHQLFREQVGKNPAHTAVIGPQGETMSYKQLDESSDQLAGLLRKKGITEEAAVGIRMEPSLSLMTGLMGTLKAGGAYLPIDPALPATRVAHMLKDSCAPFLLSDKQTAIELLPKVKTFFTPPPKHIEAFDKQPRPDRTLIDLQKYKNKIGMASVAHAISVQATRGCPYKCIYCHKVWSKNHVFRSAENIFEEVHHFYKKGVRNIAFIDDCFNLHMANSSRFFELVLKNKLDMQIFFPNGLRGDIMTPEYIDLMTEAGCRGINLSLETASPRLQKLLKKHLDIDKFRTVMEYIASKHPEVILEIATMHGFPTETEEEAMMTLDFVKSIKWLHFPYIHILKIYPNTEMEDFALEHGVDKEDILRSKDLAFHELPDTLPFPKSFTRQYQSDFLNNYFMDKERLEKVIPVQLEVLSEEAMVQKYDAYVPAEINNMDDILEFTGMKHLELPRKDIAEAEVPTAFTEAPPKREVKAESRRMLLLDLSSHFSSHSMLYNVSEQPVGLLYLLTHIRKKLGDAVDGRIYKAREDFDSYDELKKLVEDYQPELIGIRSLTFYKEFFHETVAMLRQWGINAPIIAGGPYATSDYDTVLKDKNISLVVMGEGEFILEKLLERMLENDFKMPDAEVLKTIPGIAIEDPKFRADNFCEFIWMDPSGEIQKVSDDVPIAPTPAFPAKTSPAAYVLYTSGTTGKPKGVVVEHSQVLNCIWWMQDMFKLEPHHQVGQRTPLTFDPSVWELFWPQVMGATTRLFPENIRKDAVALVEMLLKNESLTVMYCTATLVTALVSFLRTNPPDKKIKLPWFITGAEPIAMETVRGLYRYLEGTLVNTYGPTEGTINNTYYVFPRDDKRTEAPIGKPVYNNQVYIVSEDLHPVPIKAVGEIMLGGDSLARGYLNDPEKTINSFVDNPFGPGKMYHTGDLGSWLPDGQVRILTRTDDQMKLRGYRIEPGEIEAALMSSSEIEDCAVIAGEGSEWDKRIKVCRKCGISTRYAKATIGEDGVCNFCNDFHKYKEDIDRYFRTPEELKAMARKASAEAGSKYDCLILYNGGRAAGYAIYKLVELGLKVMAITYDNFYFSKKEIANIKNILASVGVDHDIVTHEKTDYVLKRSLEKAQTVCRGCFHISSSLAAQYALTHNIPVTIGATLSRGQVIENKLLPFLDQGITELSELEAKVAELGGSAVNVDKDMFDLIDIKEVSDGSIRKKVKGVDFFRYFDVTNKDMIEYLDNRDPYWLDRKRYAVYSTNCSIKQLGDYGVLHETGLHYYGAATSWEKRLGHITMDNLEEDLSCSISSKQHDRFLEHFGIPAKPPAEAERFIAAYIVTNKEDIDIGELRERLALRLPDYMMPAYFTVMDDIPLTANGKVDRIKLPDPRKSVLRKAFVAPEEGVQQILADTWSEVLGVEKIGIDDNFFQVGGDSIKAIQVAAKLVSKQLKLEISELFSHPTIREVEEFVQSSGPALEEVEYYVIGDIALTAVQNWFFQSHAQQYRHHFNQSVMLYKKDHFDEDILKKLLERITDHHDVLRMIYPSEQGKQVTQFNRGSDDPLFQLDVFALSAAADIEEEIKNAANEIQCSFNLAEGPLLKAGLFKTPGGDHLLVAVHHLVVDGVSWRILLEDLGIGYKQAEAGDAIVFQEKTHSFRQWVEKLHEYAVGAEALDQLEYWQHAAQTKIEPLPTDFSPAGSVTNETRSSVGMQLEAAETASLLSEVHKAYNTEINDILLAALGLAFHQWAGLSDVVITLEGHGREDIIPGLTIARTVGWFTSMYPVVLEMGADPDISSAVKSVKETLRRIPRKGVGYGILKYITPEEEKKGISLDISPDISFNYLGQFDQGKEESEESIGMSSLDMGDQVSPHLEPHHLIDVGGMVSGGVLAMTFSYNGKTYEEATMQGLADSYRAVLMEIINHCLGKEETEMTVSDYGGSDLDEDEVDAVFDELDLDE
ncbi:MAG: AMP-binding protein [bacterium]|nr:AMP-binding protein [bacterium]